ncbi:hypothetical protein DPMN_122905 [Dreissena polymorpha]|uniref:Uncharacterized protein n=1 Tax=Dreissena polymorpha TaxID=45954 RepID=A0A9D4GTB2_DREPO|nr:hypothetical protein DPMN_122905 [Dreissena polymorpha]
MKMGFIPCANVVPDQLTNWCHMVGSNPVRQSDREIMRYVIAEIESSLPDFASAHDGLEPRWHQMASDG